MTENDAVQKLFARIAAFEWDEAKRERNLRDRGIDFEDALQIFDGPTFHPPIGSRRRGPVLGLWLRQWRRDGGRLHVPRSKLPPDLGAQSEA